MPSIYLEPVTYSSKRLPPSLSVIDAGPADPGAAKAMIKVLSTKYSHWRYEQEMRCFLTLDKKDKETGLYFRSFSGKMSLKEVIVGACSTITQVELNDALGDLGANVDRRKARLAFGSFTVAEERNAELWE